MTVAIDSTTSITITWLPPSPSLWNGIVLSYTVEYQRQESPDLNNPPEPYITSTSSIPSLPQHPLANNPDPRLVTLPLVEERLHLEGLEENYVYRFTVYFENSAGRSEVSAPVQVRMPSSGRHILPDDTTLLTFHLHYTNFKSPTVPSGPPVNVTVEAESSTSIFISWQPPETLKQNGIITTYRIYVNPVITPSQLYTYNITSDATSFNITGEED